MRRVFSDRGRLQGMLDFEAALARAEARAGVIPTTAAESIASQCRAELFDIPVLSEASAVAGNSAIPVINELTKLVSSVNSEAANYVHWGATSQDAMDTGLVLQIREGLNLIEADARKLCAALEKLAVEHKRTPIAGRTWLQQAAPTTFGLKVAGWLSSVASHVETLCALRKRVLTIQFGGATGTCAALGEHADQTAAFLAEELKLWPSGVPWHAQRERLAEAASALGVLVGSLGKMARDISLMTQSEVAEVAEPSAPGRGGSSSMPQKRNPVGCATVLANAMRVPALVSVILSAMPQEHERGLGGWQAEWDTLPEIFLLASGALTQMLHVMRGLKVDTRRMLTNLDATNGLIYAESLSTALGRKIGRATAHKLVETVCRRAEEQKWSLFEAACADPEITRQLSPAELKELFTPGHHVRAAARLVDKAIAAARDKLAACTKEESACPSRK